MEVRAQVGNRQLTVSNHSCVDIDSTSIAIQRSLHATPCVFHLAYCLLPTVN